MVGGLTLITPTGGRPEAFALCERWISRQTYTGPLEWLCSDDFRPQTICTMGQEIHHPPWIWQPGQNTQAANLRMLLEHVRHDKILFIEDDDVYLPDYLEEMSYYLDLHPITGEGNAHYYNVARRAYLECGNIGHASLCQTGIRAELIPKLQFILAAARGFIDLNLWRLARHPEGVFFGRGLCVGIKGLPGRGGIGCGHRRDTAMFRDPDGQVLRRWIGDDAELYAKYGELAA